MKIAQKLGLLVGSLLMAMIMVIVGLSLQIVTVADDWNELLTGQVARRAEAQTLQVTFRKLDANFKNLLLTPVDAATQKERVAKLTAEDAKLREQTKKLLASATNQRIRASLHQFQTTYDSIYFSFRAAYTGYTSGLQTGNQANDSIENSGQFASDLVDSILTQSQDLVNESIAEQKAATRQNVEVIIGLSLLVLLIAAAAATAAIRGIVRPVRLLTAAALDAAENRLPRVVAQIATLPDDAPTPTLPKFEVTTRDELATLASALTSMQDSAVDLALDQRRNEKANADTLVNLGRRNQSLLTRMLTYVTEMEQDERDADVLDKLFRLDHLTTRIRRNAESLLVLAGAKQTRTWSQPIAIDDVLQAALSEIEEYTRVTIHHVDAARVHGGVAADLTHMLAELLENATRFSPRERQVLVVGRLTPSGYQFDLIDAGLGMNEEELETANTRIVQAGQKRPDTKVLGHHVVGRIAARRGIFVRLLPSVQTGITAQVLVPAALLSDTAAPAAVPAPPADVPAEPVSAEPAPQPAAQPAPEAPAPAAPAMAAPVAAPVAAPQPTLPTPRPQQPLPDRVPAPVAAAQPPSAEPLVQRGVSAQAGALPGRRVRGAQLQDLAEPEPENTRAPRDAAAIRSQFSSLQSGIAAARRETATPQPSMQQVPYQPGTVAGAAAPTRRVRGAQLAELGPDSDLDAPVPPRDAAAIGRQLSGLQAATNRARFETGQSTDTDDTFGSNA
jgi:hypothetical protein